VPVVSPVTLMTPESAWYTTPVIPPGFDVAVYRVIAKAPLDAGAVKATVAVVGPVAVTAPIPGAGGTPCGVTDVEALDETEVPAEFVAVTVKV
jgi:hypothetical protein